MAAIDQYIERIADENLRGEIQMELPPREVLQRPIQKSLEIAKARFEYLIEEE
ncbi:hypothetical protein L6475_02770 [Prevotella sp. E9-3]|uniref:hypothetical protein n=1 Tax=Prevotella sp. E9-3 TaxID=2913621 RepID=UPI001EDA4010|nr:hypothetical protein [Prevotella sp. E9-3]UKK48908.1 hypothetical protein L6475_02770 [Prevotella sp. E9-3]